MSIPLACDLRETENLIKIGDCLLDFVKEKLVNAAQSGNNCCIFDMQDLIHCISISQDRADVLKLLCNHLKDKGYKLNLTSENIKVSF